MAIHRARRVQGSRVMPKIAQTITQKSKKVFINVKWGNKGKQKMSFHNHEISQKSLDNKNSLILKISELAKITFH